MDNKKTTDFNQKINSNKESFTKKLGDKLERLGEKIAEKGDQIEHSRDRKSQR